MDPSLRASLPSLPTRELRRVFVVLVAGTTLGMILAVVARFGGRDHLAGFVPRFDPRFEGTVHAWLGSLMLGGSAALLWLIARVPGRPMRRQWLGLTLGFLFLSADEALQLHEKLYQLAKAAIGAELHSHLWTVPALVASAIVGLMYLPFLKHLPARTRRDFLVAAALFLGGAIGMEAVSGLYAASQGEGPVYFALCVTEETMELSGAAFFVVALVDYAQTLATNERSA